MYIPCAAGLSSYSTSAAVVLTIAARHTACNGLAVMLRMYGGRPHQHFLTVAVKQWSLPHHVCRQCATDAARTSAAAPTLLHKYRHQLTATVRAQYLAAYTFYDQFMHMDDVRQAQQRVIDIQQQLQLAQHDRRAMAAELTGCRNQIQRLHEELGKVERFERRYVDLVREQYDLFQLERQRLAEFDVRDTDERELFTQLTIAVKVSHETEKIYANTVKYWSIIGSIVGAILGILGTWLSFQLRARYQTEIVAQMAHVSGKLTDVSGCVAGIHGTVTALDGNLRRLEDRIMNEFKRFHIKSTAATARTTATSESWSHWTWRKTVGAYRYFVPVTRG